MVGGGGYLIERLNHLCLPYVESQLPDLLHLLRGVHAQAAVGQLSIAAARRKQIRPLANIKSVLWIRIRYISLDLDPDKNCIKKSDFFIHSQITFLKFETFFYSVQSKKKSER